MTAADLLRHRLRNQHVSSPPLARIEQAVAWLGAVQAQEYPGASWAMAQRCRGVTATQVDQALASGAIIRTHIMRPTWHFVPAADIRWMLALTAPRVNTVCRSYYLKMKLDDRVFARSHAALTRALQGGRTLSRTELRSALREAGVISAKDDPLRFAFIVLRAELDAVICSGPRVGKQFTYALLDERVPAGPVLDRDEARAELARRYFRSHGPATVKDFSWWSGLTMVDARAGVESVGSELVAENLGDKVYWRPRRSPAAGRADGAAYLLPTYDECFVAYRDRAPVAPAIMAQIVRDKGQMLIIGDRAAGTWQRKVLRDSIQLQVISFTSFSRTQRAAIEAVAERYARFTGAPVSVSMS